MAETDSEVLRRHEEVVRVLRGVLADATEPLRRRRGGEELAPPLGHLAELVAHVLQEVTERSRVGVQDRVEAGLEPRQEALAGAALEFVQLLPGLVHPLDERDALGAEGLHRLVPLVRGGGDLPDAGGGVGERCRHLRLLGSLLLLTLDALLRPSEVSLGPCYRVSLLALRVLQGASPRRASLLDRPLLDLSVLLEFLRALAVDLLDLRGVIGVDLRDTVAGRLEALLLRPLLGVQLLVLGVPLGLELLRELGLFLLDLLRAVSLDGLELLRLVSLEFLDQLLVASSPRDAVGVLLLQARTIVVRLAVDLADLALRVGLRLEDLLIRLLADPADRLRRLALQRLDLLKLRRERGVARRLSVRLLVTELGLRRRVGDLPRLLRRLQRILERLRDVALRIPGRLLNVGHRVLVRDPRILQRVLRVDRRTLGRLRHALRGLGRRIAARRCRAGTAPSLVHHALVGTHALAEALEREPERADCANGPRQDRDEPTDSGSQGTQRRDDRRTDNRDEGHHWAEPTERLRRLGERHTCAARARREPVHPTLGVLRVAVERAQLGDEATEGVAVDVDPDVLVLEGRQRRLDHGDVRDRVLRRDVDADGLPTDRGQRRLQAAQGGPGVIIGHVHPHLVDALTDRGQLTLDPGQLGVVDVHVHAEALVADLLQPGAERLEVSTGLRVVDVDEDVLVLDRREDPLDLGALSLNLVLVQVDADVCDEVVLGEALELRLEGLEATLRLRRADMDLQVHTLHGLLEVGDPGAGRVDLLRVNVEVEVLPLQERDVSLELTEGLAGVLVVHVDVDFEVLDLVEEGVLEPLQVPRSLLGIDLHAHAGHERGLRHEVQVLAEPRELVAALVRAHAHMHRAHAQAVQGPQHALGGAVELLQLLRLCREERLLTLVPGPRTRPGLDVGVPLSVQGGAVVRPLRLHHPLARLEVGE